MTQIKLPWFQVLYGREILEIELGGSCNALRALLSAAQSELFRTCASKIESPVSIDRESRPLNAHSTQFSDFFSRESRCRDQCSLSVRSWNVSDKILSFILFVLQSLTNLPQSSVTPATEASSTCVAGVPGRFVARSSSKVFRSEWRSLRYARIYSVCGIFVLLLRASRGIRRGDAHRTYIEIRCLGRRQIVWTTTTTTTSFDCCSLLFDRVTSESHPALAPILQTHCLDCCCKPCGFCCLCWWSTSFWCSIHMIYVACANIVLRLMVRMLHAYTCGHMNVGIHTLTCKYAHTPINMISHE